MQEIKIPSPNGELDATLIRADKPDQPIVILVHGWTSSKDGYVETANRLQQKVDVNYIAISLSGHGNNPGKPEDFTIRQHQEDMQAVYDYAKSLDSADTSKIGVVGSSYGSYQTILLTKSRDVSSILLRVPAIYLNSWYDDPKGQSHEKYDFFNKEVKDAKENWALEALREYKNPVTIVEHEMDEQVPAFVPKAYAGAAKENNNLEYFVTKGAPHTAREQEHLDEFDDIIAAWINKTLLT